MDDPRFDALTRSFALGASRRTVLRGLLGGLLGTTVIGGKAFAQDEEPVVVETETPVEPVIEETPQPVETAPPEPLPTEVPTSEASPTEVPPTEAPPTETPTAENPTAQPAVQQAAEGTPAAQPAGVPPESVCDPSWVTCDAGCCQPGWRCCGVYCIPDREGSCCADSECDACEICSLDGVCYEVCKQLELTCCIDDKDGSFTCAECCYNDPNCEVVVDCDFCESIGQQCCYDDKHRVSCAHCCDDSDCHAEWGACHTCYGGYCLSCGDQTDGRATVCALDACSVSVGASDDSGSYCVQCCDDWQCPVGTFCHYGWCEPRCKEGERYCGLGDDDDDDDGYCAQCCDREHCGDCEECYQGHCAYQCDKGEVCCHGEYCAWEHEGCCGTQGDWCQPLLPADNLNGSCCGDLSCCWDDKTKSGTCAECCGDYDCPSGYCCNGVCAAECCDDKDCHGGICSDGHCLECRDNSDCGYGTLCCEGRCFEPGYECCYKDAPDPVNCGECESCYQGFCRPTGVELYGSCNPMVIFSSDEATPQLNCCNGLVCCDTNKYGLVCLECCADADCADGCYCDEGFCSCPCWSDKDCAAGTCCCGNGSCSADCCHTPPPPKPGPKPTPATGGTITTLPATGSGPQKSGSGLLGAAALGAAAAYLASRKLKPDQTPEAPAPEE